MNEFPVNQDERTQMSSVQLRVGSAQMLDDLQAQSDCIVLGVFEDPPFVESSASLGHAVLPLIAHFNTLRMKSNQVRDILLPEGRYLIVGLGNAADFSLDTFRSAVRVLADTLMVSGCPRAFWLLDSFGHSYSLRQKLREVVFALHQAAYLPPTAPPSRSLHDGIPPTSILLCKQHQPIEHVSALDDALHCRDGMKLAQDLSNLPPNLCTPALLAKHAKSLQSPTLTCEVLGQSTIEDLGMGGLLAVAQGSRNPAQFIIMQYQGDEASAAPVVLIGKGVTFDSGGISIKPSAGLEQMKFDMAGAAVVLGVMNAVARAGLAINVTALIPACENMPGGAACRPGDVITTLSGKTVEILNTDAEGRLILCDALTYARRFEPTAVIDVATLTGGVIAALGHHRSGLFSNDDALAEELSAAADSSADPVWSLPLDRVYREPLVSRNADIANFRQNTPSSITGAVFLSEFAKGLKWAHLDVAGTAWTPGTEPEATGRPVPLLFDYLCARAANR